MFGLSLKWVITIVMVFILTLTQLLTSTLPDIFLPRIMLPYQAWIVAIWLFIFLLPVNVTPF